MRDWRAGECVRSGICVLVAFVAAFTTSTARAESASEPEPETAPPQAPQQGPQQEPQQPAESTPPRRSFELGPSFAMGFTTPSSGNLFTNVYALFDARFVIAIRAVGPLWVRLEPGTTMSWNGTGVRQTGTSPPAPPPRLETVRVQSVGVRALAAVDLSSRAVLRGGAAISYGGASLPDDACGGGTRGGAGFGGILGTGFRPDPDRRWEIGAELGVWIYPYADKCIEDRAQRTSFVRLQENPELAATLGATWFLF